MLLCINKQCSALTSFCHASSSRRFQLAAMHAARTCKLCDTDNFCATVNRNMHGCQTQCCCVYCCSGLTSFCHASSSRRFHQPSATSEATARSRLQETTAQIEHNKRAGKRHHVCHLNKRIAGSRLQAVMTEAASNKRAPLLLSCCFMLGCCSRPIIMCNTMQPCPPGDQLKAAAVSCCCSCCCCAVLQAVHRSLCLV
jgi:hypothetical protein